MPGTRIGEIRDVEETRFSDQPPITSIFSIAHAFTKLVSFTIHHLPERDRLIVMTAELPGHEVCAWNLMVKIEHVLKQLLAVERGG